MSKLVKHFTNVKNIPTRIPTNNNNNKKTQTNQINKPTTQICGRVLHWCKDKSLVRVISLSDSHSNTAENVSWGIPVYDCSDNEGKSRISGLHQNGKSKRCLFKPIEKNILKTYVFSSTVTALLEIVSNLPLILKTISLIVGMWLTKVRLIWMLKPSSWHSETSKWLQGETSL